MRWVTLALAEGAMQPDEGIARLETLAVAWRGDEIEAGALGQLGTLYAGAGRWRDAFTAARRASRIFPDHDLTRALHEDTGRLFEDLFLSGKGESLARVDALALYFDFKEFTPIGRRGDEIVRRLSDRLVELDLLDQAGDLLWHQVEHRLSGAARATVAARLATVRLMDGKPQAALQTIQATRLPELPAAIKRARILLEARALSDLSRTDLALDVIAGESGPEIDRLRADILWTGRRWRDAGEEHERLVGTRWQDSEALGDRERRDVLRAAIAYSLADEARTAAHPLRRQNGGQPRRPRFRLPDPTEDRFGRGIPRDRPRRDERRHARRVPRRIPQALPRGRGRRAPPRPRAGRAFGEAAGAGADAGSGQRLNPQLP